MSNTPLVNTRGRGSAAMRACVAAASAILRGYRGSGSAVSATCWTIFRSHASGHVFEQLDHAHHTRRGARDLSGRIALRAADDAHQVDRPALGDDLDMRRRELVGFDETRLDLRCDERVVRAR